MLKRSKRLHGESAVKTVLKEGHRISSPFFACTRLPNTLNTTRYAAVVGKKIAKLAVDRNRGRRQIYEAIQLLEKAKEVPSDSSSDIVIVVRAPGLKASFEDLKTALSTLLRRPS